MRAYFCDVESRYYCDAFPDFPVIGVDWNQTQAFSVTPRLSASLDYHRILLTPALTVNNYGEVEISRIRQIMVEYGKLLAYGYIAELQDPDGR